MVYATISLYQVDVILGVQCCCAYPVINMKVYILFTILFIHTTTATLDLQKIKDTAATKIQKITDTASSSLQQFADTIDFDTVQKLDILDLIPKLQYKGMLIKDTYENIPEYSQQVKTYIQKIKGLIKKDLALAFEAPWPMKRRMDVDGYY